MMLEMVAASSKEDQGIAHGWETRRSLRLPPHVNAPAIATLSAQYNGQCNGSMPGRMPQFGQLQTVSAAVQIGRKRSFAVVPFSWKGRRGVTALQLPDSLKSPNLTA
jgi:hypothetical protein